MLGSDLLRLVFVLGPIAALLTLGLGLTVRSGVVGLSTGQGWRRAAGNLSQTILLVAGSLLGLLVLQQFVGFKLGVL